jgi:hypothetical protein
LPFDLIWVHGCSATFAGAAIVPMFVLMAFPFRYTGGLTDRYCPRLPLVVGPTIAAVGFTLFAVSAARYGRALCIGLSICAGRRPLVAPPRPQVAVLADVVLEALRHR